MEWMAEVSVRPMRLSGLLFLLLALYFIVNIVVRLSLPASLELDEAEQIFYSQWLALGYGPQPPLYNWLQTAVFTLTGRTVFGLSLLKNGLLFSTYLFYWLAARRVLKDEGLRIVAVLSLLTLPQVSFMAEQDLAHTVALIAATALFLYAFFRIVDRGDAAGYLLAGISIGLGFLAKYNFALLPAAALVAVLPERELRDRVFNWRLALAVAVAVAIVLPHLLWLWDNLDLATTQTLGKMTDHREARIGVIPALEGLASLAVAIVAFSALTLVIFVAIYRSAARRVLTARSTPIRIVERMLVLLLAALALIIIATGTTTVRERWLDPFLLVLPLYLCMKIEAAGTDQAVKRKGLIAIPLAIMVLVPASIFLRVATASLTGDYTRVNIPSDRFVKAEVSDRDIVPALVVAADRHLAGNIGLSLPGVPVMTTQFPDFVLPFSASDTRPILLAWRTGTGEAMPPALEKWLAQNIGADVRPEINTIALPYHYQHGDDVYSYYYAWLRPAAK